MSKFPEFDAQKLLSRLYQSRLPNSSLATIAPRQVKVYNKYNRQGCNKLLFLLEVMIKVIPMTLPWITVFRLHNNWQAQTIEQPKIDDQDYTHDLTSDFGDSANKLVVHPERQLLDPPTTSKPSQQEEALESQTLKPFTLFLKREADSKESLGCKMKCRNYLIYRGERIANRRTFIN